MGITKNDFFSVRLNAEVIDKECFIWHKFFSCNKKMELMSFISDVNFMTLWEHKIINYSNENEKDYVLFIDRLVVEMDKQNEVLSGVGFSLNHSYKIKLLQAIEILSQNDVVLGYALQNFIGRILIVNCDSLVASSSILYLGLVIISPKDDWTIFDYMENLIHEMSHIELYIKQLVDPLVLSGTTLKSPFRIYPRPANGVFHAVFVLTRIIYYLNKLRFNNDFNKEISIKINNASLLLSESIVQFKSVDILTPLGKKIIEEARFILNGIQENGAENDCIRK